MEKEAYTLNDLRELSLPRPPEFWPLAPGLWLLIAVVVIVLVSLTLFLRTRWNNNAYRRSGLSLLQTSTNVYDLSVLLKRVALAAYPRKQVASLYGHSWAKFLAATCPGKSYETLCSTDPQQQATAEHKQLAAHWIRHHQPPQSPPVSPH